MRRGELRALLLKEAHRRKAGGAFAVRRAVRPSGQLQPASELIEQIEAAIKGWQHYIEIDRLDAAGNVVILVKRTPPQLI